MGASKRSKRAEPVGVTSDTARQMALDLPGVVEGRSYGLPALTIGKKFFARLRDRDTVLVINLGSFPDREFLIAQDPDTFFTTDHYRNYPTVLVRLASVRESQLRELLADARSRFAPASGRPRRSAI
jgi:hypothetical protein